MLLFAAAVFSGAFLLFLLQPLAGRIILPWFGGAAAVWTTCLMFFQTALLLGYLYAHASVRLLKPRTQAIVHATLLGLSLLALPVLPGAEWKPAGPSHPIGSILLVLAAAVGAPYLLLSTTGPLVQAWFARSRPDQSPYRLYALSNTGSLLALLAYPVVIEPRLRIGAQAYAWSAAYAAFAVLCGILAFRSARAPQLVAAGETPASSPRWTRKALWIAFAFCPSALLGAVTSHLTQNIAPIPLLWVLPLAVYLLSFILTFESERWYRRRFWFPAFIASVAVLLAFLFPASANASVLIVAPVFIAGFFVCAMTCHGELYRLRPDARHLTSFYLMISLGGALGGLFVGVLAPVLFRTYLEAPIALLVSVLLFAAVLRRDVPALPGPVARYIEVALLAGVAGGFVFLLAVDTPRWEAGFRVVNRNFYGALRVADHPQTDDTDATRELLNGTISHGSEFLDPQWHELPTTYYGPKSGVGIAIANAHNAAGRRLGVIGLGAGTIAAYGRPGDVVRFYEINPLVMQIARDQFYFLKDTPAKVDIVPGDARLSLEREQPQRYDVLAVDAFSGDSIPVHLLTVQAVQQYFRHTTPDGVVAIHVSNKYLELPRVVAGIARQLHKPAIVVEDNGADPGVDRSDWVLLTNSDDTFSRPEWKPVGRKDLPENGLRVWTDDYSNILGVMKWTDTLWGE